MEHLKTITEDWHSGEFFSGVFILLLSLLLAWGLTFLVRRFFAQLAQHQKISRSFDASTKNQVSVWLGTASHRSLLLPLLTLGFITLGRLISNGSDELLALVTPLLVVWALAQLVTGVLKTAFPESVVARSAGRFAVFLLWVSAMLWLTELGPSLLDKAGRLKFAIGSNAISLRQFGEGLLLSILSVMLSLWIAATLERQWLQPGIQDLSLRIALTRTLRTFLLIIILLLTLSAAGINLSAFSVLFGALGVGLGFGLQRLAANYISGFIILMERSFRIGDWVRLEDFEGIIIAIQTRYTLIRSLDGRISVVPNELLVTRRAENHTLQNSDVLITTRLVLALDTDVERAVEVIRATLLTVPVVMKKEGTEPAVLLIEISSRGLLFKICFWINDPELNAPLRARSDANFALLAVIKREGFVLGELLPQGQQPIPDVS